MTRMRSQVRILYRPSYLYDYTCLQVTVCDKTLDAQGFRAVLSILFVLVRMLSGPGFGPLLGRFLGRLFFGLLPCESLRSGRSISRSAGRLPRVSTSKGRWLTSWRMVDSHRLPSRGFTTGELLSNFVD